MTLEEKKKTKMQCKKNDHGVCSPALQVKNHVHQILYSTQFRRGQKSPIPLRGLDDLSGLFSSDILRFLQVQPQVSSTDIKTVRRDFPGGPVVETQRSQCRGCTFDPCSGNWDPTCRAAWPKKNFFFLIKKKKKKKGLLWWYRELESVCQCRGHRFDPWSGRIPQPVKQ